MTTKRRGGWHNPASAANGRRGGRPRKPPTVQIAVDLDTAAPAQRLMLRQWPGVENIEQLIAYALRRLDETADD